MIYQINSPFSNNFEETYRKISVSVPSQFPLPLLVPPLALFHPHQIGPTSPSPALPAQRLALHPPAYTTPPSLIPNPPLLVRTTSALLPLTPLPSKSHAVPLSPPTPPPPSP